MAAGASEIREEVRARYAEIARTVDGDGGCCGGEPCCGDAAEEQGFGGATRPGERLPGRSPREPRLRQPPRAELARARSCSTRLRRQHRRAARQADRRVAYRLDMTDRCWLSPGATPPGSRTLTS